MLSILNRFRHTLALKLILTVGVTLFAGIFIWAYFSIKYQKTRIMNQIITQTVRLGNTIKLGMHYAMMHNLRNDINHIIMNIAKQEDVQTIRIFNKSGRIKFSNRISEVDKITNIKAEACDVCHRFEPPVYELPPEKMTRFLTDNKGNKSIGIITPILNEPGCAAGSCHFHPDDKKVLGALDVVISMGESDSELFRYEKDFFALALFMFLFTSTIICIVMVRFVNEPIQKLIIYTNKIAKGKYNAAIDIKRNDEIGELADAISKMGKEIYTHQTELNQQKEKYQFLFDSVPCTISIQDRDYRITGYNREFAESFTPSKGEYCYVAYKGRKEKCRECPVEKTFLDGKPHYSEEFRVNKDGSRKYWLVKTAPVRDASGKITSAIEMCFDVTPRKRLEEDLKKSEHKYYAIFNNIPNPVFVLAKDDYKILDCNKSMEFVYGYSPNEIIGRSFFDLFCDDEKSQYLDKIINYKDIEQVRHKRKDGGIIYVTIKISPSEFFAHKVLLVTIADITKRLETEQQLSQASKLATLGEMATGVAHELNQPLTVIKMASGFFMKKVEKKEEIPKDILYNMSEKINKNIDRANKIIQHMREFARKSNMSLEKVNVNNVLESAFEIFSQQLKLRKIEVIWDLKENIPPIMADSARLEQVFINLLINARDAIEEKWEKGREKGQKKIFLISKANEDKVMVKVSDTGNGIPKDIGDKIFEPFFTTKEVGKGTGLGLSISYGIVKDYHGEIRAYSNEFGGACFHLEFPVYHDSEETNE